MKRNQFKLSHNCKFEGRTSTSFASHSCIGEHLTTCSSETIAMLTVSCANSAINPMHTEPRPDETMLAMRHQNSSEFDQSLDELSMPRQPRRRFVRPGPTKYEVLSCRQRYGRMPIPAYNSSVQNGRPHSCCLQQAPHRSPSEFGGKVSALCTALQSFNELVSEGLTEAKGESCDSDMRQQNVLADDHSEELAAEVSETKYAACVTPLPNDNQLGEIEGSQHMKIEMNDADRAILQSEDESHLACTLHRTSYPATAPSIFDNAGLLRHALRKQKPSKTNVHQSNFSESEDSDLSRGAFRDVRDTDFDSNHTSSFRTSKVDCKLSYDVNDVNVVAFLGGFRQGSHANQRNPMIALRASHRRPCSNNSAASDLQRRLMEARARVPEEFRFEVCDTGSISQQVSDSCRKNVRFDLVPETRYFTAE